MTTPKDIPTNAEFEAHKTGKKPDYMFPALQGLPDELRKLGEVARECVSDSVFDAYEAGYYEGKYRAFRQAAQMVEERLNGSA